MKARFVLLLSLCIVTGCQHTLTQRRSNQLMTTVPDIYYQQVVDNLARVYAKPGSMAYFATTTQGTDTVTRQIQATYTPGWDFITGAGGFAGKYLFDKQTAAISGTHMNAEAFQLAPVADPDKIYMMTIAFRWAAGDTTLTPYEKSILVGFYHLRSDKLPIYKVYFKAITGCCIDDVPDPNKTLMWSRCPFDTPQSNDAKTCCTRTPPICQCDSNQLPPDGIGTVSDPKNPAPTGPLCLSDPPVNQAEWFYIAQKKKDAKHACYVGRCCDVRVCVVPGSNESLTAFTLAILDLATLGSTAAPPLPWDAKKAALETKLSEMKSLDVSPNTAVLYLMLQQMQEPRATVLPNRSTPTFPYPAPP